MQREGQNLFRFQAEANTVGLLERPLVPAELVGEPLQRLLRKVQIAVHHDPFRQSVRVCHNTALARTAIKIAT